MRQLSQIDGVKAHPRGEPSARGRSHERAWWILLTDNHIRLTIDQDAALTHRVIAIAQTRGAPAALAALDELGDNPRLATYRPYWAARAGLLARIGDHAAADLTYEQAIGLESDPAVRRFLQRKRAER